MIRPDLHLSPSFLAWLAPYLAVFSRRTRPTASALAVGALLAVGPRTGNWGKTPGTQLQQNKGQSGSVTLPP